MRKFLKAIHRRIIIASPHCTLWVSSGWNVDAWHFRFYPAWKITGQDYVEAL